jgi:hypothetical protein
VSQDDLKAHRPPLIRNNVRRLVQISLEKTVMISNTQAFIKYKTQGETMFNFVVVACYSVPTLRKQIEGIQAGTVTSALSSPDYFKNDNNTPEGLFQKSADYTRALASYVLLSGFSYFEAYVIDAVREMITFHGGIEKMEKRARTFITSTPSHIIAHKRKLQEPIKPSKYQKYQKHTRELMKAGFQFPSDLLSGYGARALERKLDGLKAFEIPNLLQEGLLMTLSKPTLAKYTATRKMRNDVAHGQSVTIELRTAMQACKNLHTLAAQVDKHLVEHYFIIEEYVGS